MKHNKITEQDYRMAIANSRSKRQALMTLGVKPEGGNYRVINNAIEKYQIDTSHWSGKGWNKGIKTGPKRNIEEYLVQSPNVLISSFHLKLRLFEEKILEKKCSNCGISEWLDNPISLELDHINGVHLDNRLENLRILCPNCHSQTSTWRGKNAKK